MATALAVFRPISPSYVPSLPSVPSPENRHTARFRRRRCAGGFGRWRAMVQQQTFQDHPFSKVDGISSGLVLVARYHLLRDLCLSRRSPATLAYLLGLDMLMKDGYSKVTANLKFLNSIESKFLLTTKLSVEGPTRMKEEYVEGHFETPTVSEEAIPAQLRGAFGQAADARRQLPAPLRDTFANGLKLPLSGIFQRLFMISYLDEEILIMRDSAGAPDVLTRLDGPPAASPTDPVISEYES
ncbi:hypothetical protein COCNU_11G010400 [Cocos nucifera]|uniref:Plastid lipid-associated protein/fibrillin conserved domain-containing protein n=1 Tax=Cocos nucifera TaxID=13894 RepID=A0A8K0IQF2_COCNU|nr:hypothetical protein COCNU_11G010400 [Cocos nucifera]